MKNLFLLLIILATFMYGCNCLGQLPKQYAYVNENCEAPLPDLLPMVVVSDNCFVTSIIQTPAAGVIITQTTTVKIEATDDQGNLSSVDVEVEILDTIAPTILLNPDWVGYNGESVHRDENSLALAKN